MRFWDPDQGAVLVGGIDSRTLPVERLRDLVALVPQDVYLFNDSVRANIRLGRPEASDAEVARALVAEFIPELPDGLDTVIGERGATLSGGQRQRIAIARALLKDAPILVMDEAVSNLDTENEQALNAAMAEARRGRTTLLIAPAAWNDDPPNDRYDHGHSTSTRHENPTRPVSPVVCGMGYM